MQYFFWCSSQSSGKEEQYGKSYAMMLIVYFCLFVCLSLFFTFKMTNKKQTNIFSTLKRPEDTDDKPVEKKSKQDTKTKKHVQRTYTLSVKVGNKISVGCATTQRKTTCFVVIVANLTNQAKKNVFREDGCTSVRKEVVKSHLCFNYCLKANCNKAFFRFVCVFFFILYL